MIKHENLDHIVEYKDVTIALSLVSVPLISATSTSLTIWLLFCSWDCVVPVDTPLLDDKALDVGSSA